MHMGSKRGNMCSGQSEHPSPPWQAWHPGMRADTLYLLQDGNHASD